VRLVLGTNHLGLGGSESYLLTVAEQLDRLGHDVVVYAHERGAGVAVARERGFVVVDEEGLPAECDAALAQDAGVSLHLAERFPAAQQLFVAHSESLDLQAPPQLDGLLGAVVALNDRVAERMRSFATAVEVVRLRQPIDTERFTPRAPLPALARRALLFSNTPNSDRLRMLEAACGEAGLELVRLGGEGGQATDPRPALAGVDLVIGYGRSILEAMACGRAAYVYDWNGGDGWVTPASYAAIEADGIAGRGGREIIDADRLAADLCRYEASMGPVNHDLVIAHHRANVHVQQLLELFRKLAPPPPRPRAPLEEMARLVRLEWRARVDNHALVQESADLRDRLQSSERREVEARTAVAAAEGAALEEARKAGEQIRAYERSTSWRWTAPLRALGQAIRRGRGI
jgi:hypothetical protein